MNNNSSAVLNLEVSTQEGSAAVVADAAAGGGGGGVSLVLGHAVEHITSRHHHSRNNRQATLSWQLFPTSADIDYQTIHIAHEITSTKTC